MKTIEKNNLVRLFGKVDSKVEFSHENHGERFYTFNLSVNRLSEESDIIRIMISDRFPEFSQIKEGQNVYLEGEYRSYNEHKNEKMRLILSVFVKEISFKDEGDYEYYNLNSIILEGYICKPVIYRKTPLGREIADLFLAVNRPYHRSDYIPCIAWGRNARWAAGFEVGNKIKIYGRIQSREYTKKLPEVDSEENIERKTAFEVSIADLEFLEI